jgi:protein SCO1/2
MSIRYLLSAISFDPAHNTPEVLKAHGEGWNADFRHWRFATGSVQEVARFGASFGVSFWTDEGTIVHNLATAVIRPDGKLQEILRENQWTAEELVNTVEDAASLRPPR